MARRKELFLLVILISLFSLQCDHCDDSKWSSPISYKCDETDANVAIANNGNGLLCMAWRRVSDKMISISVSRDNGSTWDPQTTYPNERLIEGPSLCVHKGMFIMAWQAFDKTRPFIPIQYSYSFDGKIWSPPPKYFINFDFATDSHPVVAATDDLILMCWNGWEDNYIWSSSTTDLDRKPWPEWSIPKKADNITSLDAPSVTVIDNDFILASAGQNQTSIKLYKYLKSTGQWQLLYTLPFPIHRSPTIAYSAKHKQWYLVWRDINTPSVNVITSSAPETIRDKLTDRPTNYAPGLVFTDDKIFMFWGGIGPYYIWSSYYKL